MFSGDFVLRQSFKSRNRDNQIVKFYDKNMTYANVSFTKAKHTLRVGTLNVHGFGSINQFHTVEDSIRELFELIRIHQIDILCIQEYVDLYSKKITSYLNRFKLYSSDLTCKVVMNLIISRYPIDTIVNVPILGYGTSNSKMIIIKCTINNRPITIGNVHLSLYPRDYANQDTAEYKAAVYNTIDLHKAQLKLIYDNKLDILSGDFNFNKSEPEYQWMIDLGWMDNSSRIPTTPYGTTVDFVWTKVPKQSHVLYYPFSDHRPVIADVEIY